MTSVTDLAPHLIIVGASTRAAAESAIRAGMTCSCVDQFGDEDLRQIAASVAVVDDWPQGILDAVGSITTKLSTNCPMLLTGGLENQTDLLSSLGMMAPVSSPSTIKIVRLRDPFWVQNRLKEAALPYLLVTSNPVASDDQQANHDRRWIVKPRASAGGVGVRLFEDIPHAFWREFERDGSDYFLQEFVDTKTHCESREISGLFLVLPDRVQLLGICRQWTGSAVRQLESKTGQFQYLGGCVVRADQNLGSEIAQQADQIGQVLLKGSGGLIGVDFAWDADRRMLFCLEVNPRYTASVELYEHAANCTLVDRHLASFRHSVSAPKIHRQHSVSRMDPVSEPCLVSDEPLQFSVAAFAKRVVYAPKACQASGLNELQSRPEWPSETLICDRPAKGAQLLAAHPVCTLLTPGNSEAECFAKLRLAAKLVLNDLQEQ